ncbi:MAG: lipopolysaccharide transport system permease protein [Lysobacterales bacterium]|jgi:lipopolysaccharide transport system permease protein
MVRHTLFWQLVTREIRTAYLENLTGFAWLILQPLMLLGVYWFVFTKIFHSRIPDTEVGFLPYLAIAFWPWTAFSESILKASNSITGNAALIGKVAIATEQLPMATVTATFIMHVAGYLAILLVLQLIGTDIHWLFLPLMIPVMLLLWVFAVGLAWMFSALQVFIKDTAQILPPLMTFWFFTTPILYSQSQLPENIANVMSLNPMTWFVFQMREFLLFGRINLGVEEAIATTTVLALAWIGLKFFRRFSGHFEDFL